MAVNGKRLLAAALRAAAMPTDVEKLIQRTADAKIDIVAVNRMPITGLVDKLVRKLPGSHVPRNEVLYHLFMVLHFTDGSIYRVDKDEVVKVQKLQSYDFENSNSAELQVKIVPIAPVSAAQFFQNARKVAGPALWIYDPIVANCQFFVLWCLEGNTTLTPFLKGFIVQKDLKKYFNPLTRLGMTAVTTLANVGRRFLGANARYADAKRSRPLAVKHRRD